MASINQKNGRWHVRVRIRNRPTVCASFARRSDATKWARSTEADVLAGRYAKPVVEDEAALTVGELLQQYVDQVSVTKRGAREERNVVSLMERAPEFRGLWTSNIVDVQASAFARLRDVWLASGLAAATIRNRLSLFSSAFVHARREWELGVANPIADIKRPSARNERARRLVDDELDRIIAATRDEELPCLITLLVETAMRRSEAINLTWDKVHLAERYVHLSLTKNGASRDVPLSPLALAVLRDMPRREGPRVFTLTANAASLSFGRALARARENYREECACLGRSVDPGFLVDLCLHDLRREAASRMIESGVFNVIETAAITGHRQIAVLHRRYSVLQTPRLADKLAQAEAKRAAEAIRAASEEARAEGDVLERALVDASTRNQDRVERDETRVVPA